MTINPDSETIKNMLDRIYNDDRPTADRAFAAVEIEAWARKVGASLHEQLSREIEARFKGLE